MQNTIEATKIGKRGFPYQRSHHPNKRGEFPNKNIIIIFKDNRVQVHSDGSVLIWKNDRILFQSKKGIMNQFSVQTVFEQKNQYLLNKLSSAAQFLNLYGTCPYYINMQLNEGHTFCLKHRIKEYHWLNPEIQEVKFQNCSDFGYRVYSDDKFASLTLHPSLYEITIQYGQYLGPQGSQNPTKRNITKQLLVKYNQQYTELPDIPSKKPIYENNHTYIKTKKHMTIFNVCHQWQYPLWILWTSLKEYQFIGSGVTYVQYDWVSKLYQPQTMKQYSRTKMPKSYTLLQYCHHVQPCDKISIPILGKINHDSPCIYLQIKNENQPDYHSWFCSEYKINMFADGIGYWLLKNSEKQIAYKKTNQRQIKDKFYVNALPYKIRIKEETQRSLIEQISLFSSYVEENSRIEDLMTSQQGSLQTNKQNDGSALICEETLDFDGLMVKGKVYGSGYVHMQIPEQRLSLFLNSKLNEVKIFTKSSNTNQPIYINLFNTSSINYENYQSLIIFTLDFRDRVLYPQQYYHMVEFKQQVQNTIEQGDLYLIGCKYLNNST